MVSGEQASAVGVTRVGRVRSATVLPPVSSRAPWIACGLVIQAAAVAMVLAWTYSRYKDDAMEGVALRTTVKLIWTETLHSPAGVGILVASAVLFAVGSMLLARPYVRSLPMLLVGVPIAAIAGLGVLGAFALILALLALLAYAGLDNWSSHRSVATTTPSKKKQKADAGS